MKHICGSIFILVLLAGCNGTDADRVGVGAECTATADCPIVECDVEPCPELVCLTQFTGGYCGLSGCLSDADCPVGSACVMHDDGVNYCFRLCDDKPECNYNRSPAVESNCVGSITFVGGGGGKACEPPSSGS